MSAAAENRGLEPGGTPLRPGPVVARPRGERAASEEGAGPLGPFRLSAPVPPAGPDRVAAVASGYTPSLADLDDLSLDPLTGPLESADAKRAAEGEEDLPWLVETDDPVSESLVAEAFPESDTGAGSRVAEPEARNSIADRFPTSAADHPTGRDADGSPAEHPWVEEEALGAYVEPWDEAEFQAQETAVLRDVEPASGRAEATPAAVVAVYPSDEPAAAGDDPPSGAAVAADPATEQAREMAARLERIARALREHGPAGALGQPGGDPLAALITGYLLGSSQRPDG
jgi:hypothetical protein